MADPGYVPSRYLVKEPRAVSEVPSADADHLASPAPAGYRPRLMSDTPYVTQKVDWYQFRAPDGDAFFVMVASLPNGFYIAVPCEVTLTRAPHGLMALAASRRPTSG
jgi:hypothetical protein